MVTYVIMENANVAVIERASGKITKIDAFDSTIFFSCILHCEHFDCLIRFIHIFPLVRCSLFLLFVDTKFFFFVLCMCSFRAQNGY